MSLYVETGYWEDGYTTEEEAPVSPVVSGGGGYAVFLGPRRKTRWELELERLKGLPEPVVEVLIGEAEEAVSEAPKPITRQRKELRAALKEEGIAYREAYREVFSEMVQLMRRIADEEEEDAAIVLLHIL